ncbi:unnamed protein product [Acanthoscelides obtectus]|uniref:Uncharacterized protein n=1 Tax=Acanthoscelides obtectus TaxID=200917 RepID=A0A9P0Q8M6_ACAOB|nr:unnamed protein product [Acanthoscelides obtectus]CAK1641301.1 hypothetical protein AOBTE_LOCUS12313 [Acanthoscelides obtectus]
MERWNQDHTKLADGSEDWTRTQQRTSRLISITHFWNRRDQEDQEKPKDEDRRQSAVSSKSEALRLIGCNVVTKHFYNEIRIDALTKRQNFGPPSHFQSHSHKPRRYNYNNSSRQNYYPSQRHKPSYTQPNTTHINYQQPPAIQEQFPSQEFHAQYSPQNHFTQTHQPSFNESRQFPSQPIPLPKPLPVKQNFPTNRQVVGPPQF